MHVSLIPIVCFYSNGGVPERGKKEKKRKREGKIMKKDSLKSAQAKGPG